MKKLNLYQAEEKLQEIDLKIFTPKDLQVLFGVSQRAVAGFLNYNLKKGVFVRFRQGLYGLKNVYVNDFYLANMVYSPSYVSLETALSFYNLIPETVYAVTSATTKPTREFEVLNRLFEYRKIKSEAYSGYQPQVIDGQTVFLATPEKAVADFLYFVFLGKKNFNDRLRLDQIKAEELRKNIKLFKNNRFLSFVDRILKAR